MTGLPEPATDPFASLASRAVSLLGPARLAHRLGRGPVGAQGPPLAVQPSRARAVLPALRDQPGQPPGEARVRDPSQAAGRVAGAGEGRPPRRATGAAPRERALMRSCNTRHSRTRRRTGPETPER
jgi:hypothetical protein